MIGAKMSRLVVALLALPAAAALANTAAVRRTPVPVVNRKNFEKPKFLSAAAALVAVSVHPPAALAWGKAAVAPPTLAAVVSARAAAVVAVVAAAWTKYTAIIMAALVAAREAVLAVNYGGALVQSQSVLTGASAEAARLGGVVSQWASSVASVAAVQSGAASAQLVAASAAASARAGALAAKYPVYGSPTATLALASAVPAVLVGVAVQMLVAKARAAPARTNDELYADLKAAAGTAFKVPPLPADVAPARWMAVRGLPAAVPPQRLLLAFPHARRVEAIYAADGARASVMVEVEAAGASLRRSVTPPCSLEPVAAPPLATAGAQRKVWSRRVDTEPLLASAYGRAASA